LVCQRFPKHDWSLWPAAGGQQQQQRQQHGGGILPVLSVYCGMEKTSMGWGLGCQSFNCPLCFTSPSVAPVSQQGPWITKLMLLHLCHSYHFGSSPKNSFFI
jgi:hypothetical protein